MDSLAFGVLLIQADGCVATVNRRGDEMLRAQDGLRLYKRQLAAWRSVESKALSAWVSQAVEGGKGGVVRISRNGGKRPYLVRIISLKRGGALAPREMTDIAAILTISDPEEPFRIGLGLLQTTFDLTDTEARLCERLANGEDLAGIADAMGIAKGTARTHLKHIFSKTDTHRQSELIRLLLSSFLL